MTENPDEHMDVDLESDDEEPSIPTDYYGLKNYILHHETPVKNRIYKILVEKAYMLRDVAKLEESMILFTQALQRPCDALPLPSEFWVPFLDLTVSRFKAVAEGIHQENMVQKLIQLFSWALYDSFSMDIALQLTRLFEFSNSEQDEEVWNLMLAYGYEFNAGHLIWSAWQDCLMRSYPDTIEKLEILLDNYKMQLPIPLHHKEETHSVFRNFMTDHRHLNFDQNRIEHIFRTTQQLVERCLEFEEELRLGGSNENNQLFDIYVEYIKFIDASIKGDDLLKAKVILILYERMVESCSHGENAWKLYFEYLINQRNILQMMRDDNASPIFNQTFGNIVTKATRHNPCPAMEALAIVEEMRYFELRLEPLEAKGKIEGIMNIAWEMGFRNAIHMSTICIQYFAYLNRDLNFNDGNQIFTLRKTLFSECKRYCEEYPDYDDAEIALWKYWWDLEHGKVEMRNEVQGHDLFRKLYFERETVIPVDKRIQFG